MALTTAQQALLLFKKWLGVGQSTIAREFYQEPYIGKSAILASQVWQESDQIPLTPVGFSASGQIIGVVQYFQDLALTQVAGLTSTGSFYSSNLVDAIPFYYGGSGGYNYTLKNSTSSSISFGVNDWIVDGDAGLLTFYNGVPSNMPPLITFYKYVGLHGVGGSSISASYAATASIATSASYALNGGGGSVISASWASSSISASYALTQSYTYITESVISSSFSISSSYALTASYSMNGGGSSPSASWASSSVSSSYATTISRKIRSSVPIVATYGASAVFDKMPAVTTEMDNGIRTKVNLAGASSASLAVTVKSTGSINSKLFVEYSYNENNWDYLGSSQNTPAVTINTIGSLMGIEIPITSSALSTVILRIVGIDGDGVTSPEIGNISLHIAYDL